MDTKQLSGQATPEQIEAWKKQYGTVIQVTTDAAIGYFKKASRATLRAALSFLEKDKIKYGEILVENCFIGGDERFKNDDEHFFSLTELLPLLTESKDAEVKKL